MGLDNKTIFPETLSVQVSDQGQVIEYTREETGEINLIEGNSKLVDTEIISVGKLNEETSKYDINITTSKEINDHTLKSIKTISLDEPLRGIGNIKDMIYKYSNTDYYLYRKIGTRSYRAGDENDESVITDLTTTLYDLGIAGYYENKINFDNKIQFYGTNTTFECDSMMPNLTMTAPIDYAYNESKRKYRDEEIIIDEVDIDDRKDIDILSIEGQTYENLLQKPLGQGIVINPVELTGRDCVYTGGENTTIPLREITGDTYVNLLEDKIENTTIKPVASYNGDVVDGTRYKKEFIMNDMDTGMISRKDGITIEENSVWRFDPYYYKIANMELYIKFKANASTSICFYDIDKKFISTHSDSFNKITETKLTIPQNAIFIRFCWHSGAGDGSYVIFDKIPYNLGDYDKVTIDEIRGNTKVYNNPIPIADPTTNLWTTGDPVLQEVNQDGAYGDTSKKNYLGTATPIYVGNVENQQVYVYVLDSDGNNVSTTFAFRFYDKNLKFQNISNVATGNGGIKIDGSKTPYFLVNINGGDIIQQEGLYQIVMTTTRITTFPATYVAPTIIGKMTFPIQSIGELYVNNQGEPILDDNGNQQYKIDIISENHQNLAHGLEVVAGQNCTLTKEGDSYRAKGNGKYLCGIVIKGVPVTRHAKYILEFHGKRVKGCSLNIYDFNTTNVEIKNSPISYPEDGIARIEYYTTADGVRDLQMWFSRETAEDCEYIFSDFRIYKVNDYDETYVATTKSILLPQPLRSVGDIKDRLYWDNEKNKYCIEKNIEYLPQTSVKFSATPNAGWHKSAYMASKNVGQTAYFLSFSNISKYKQNVPVISDSFNFIETVTDYNTVKDFAYMYSNAGLLVSLDDNQDVNEWCSNNTINMNLILSTPEIVETNLTELMTFPCYDNSTYIYTSRTSSHDEVNLPPIEQLKGEITCTTLPLSTTAYIKPNTKYTMFMNTDCEVSYNLGGMEKEYSTQGKILITTPSTLSNNTLTLLGEGNIGNVTLLEGDYTNSYVPDTFINDVFSVGDLQDDGSYKIDIVSKNKNLAVIKNIDFPYTTVPTIVKNNEEKSIELRSSSGRDLLTKTNLNFKAGTTYTLSIKIETNNTNTSARIIVIDDINRQNSLGGNATTVVSIYNPATTKTVTTTFTPNVDSCLFLNLNNYSNLSSETYMKFSEIIVLEGDFNEQDINYYEGKHEVKSISLPQPLRRVGDVCDRFYWDDTRRKMCIEKNVAEIDFSNFDFSPCPYVSGRFQITVPNMITGEGSLICNSIKAYGTNHGDLHGDTTDSNGYIVGAVAIGSDKCIILRLGKGMTKDDTIQWLINHNTKIYHRISPEIIETDITEPIEIDIFDTDTTITTTSTVKPNFHLKSFSVTTVPVNIKPSTKYYVFADVTGITTINLGGSEIRYNTNDSCLEITTPSIVNENTISFIGDHSVSNVMLRTDNRLDIKYFFGKVYASAELEDGSYETVITANPMNGEEPTIVKIITSSPLKANTSITHIGDGYKYINELGEEEDVIINSIIPTSNSFNSFRAEGTVPAITNVIIPYRSIRPLKTPVNLAFNNYTDNDSHTFTWTTDVGVEGHKFYYKDELVATIDSPDPTYTYPSEMEGDVKIVAFNTLTESEGAVKDIVTLPNRSEVVALNTIYDNGYKFTIDFNDNSNIRKGYKFIYSVDDGEENVIDIPVSDKAITLSQSIDVSEVSNNMKVRINSYNSVGEAEMKEKVFYLTPTPKWAYLLSSDNLMFRHQDKFPFTTYYKIKTTNTQTLEEKEYNYGSNQGINGLIIDYLLKSNREEELSIMLTMNDGYLDHVPCVPFKVSKTLDLSLVAPQNFTMEWVGDGVAKFSWDDNYTNEDYFEFVYSLNGGIEEVVKIYPDDVAGTGGRISYTYEFDGFGILTGRVRMVWELNTSEYTDSKTATFVAVTGLPPAWIVKEYSGDNLVITWEAQSYVDHYEIMIECDGEVEILTEKKDMFYLDLKKYHGKYVSISIKTHFTTGLVTEYSDSILFKPVSTSGITNQMTYAPIKVEKDDNVSVYTKLADEYTSYQRITGLITNSNLLYNKFCKDMLTNSASFNNVFYHLVNHEYKDFVSVKTDNVSIESLIRILNYAHINQDGHLNTFVYTPITSSHTDFVDIQKVTIVCIGDSITSGHPGFWE